MDGKLGCAQAHRSSSDTPGSELSVLADETQTKVDFPLRKLVGSLQWAQTCCRPDLTQSTNALARATHKPTHKGTVAAAKRVLRCVRGTLDVGLLYPPEEEQSFEKLYKALSEHPENKGTTQILDDWSTVQSFADASFASTAELKSVSGSMVYYRGCPVSWKSSVQTVMTSSTFESEWVAQSDLLLLSRETNALVRFLNGKSEIEMRPEEMGPLWCDSRSAIISARKELLSDVARKSRHVAIRLAGVRDEAKRLAFVPTDMQRADGLTKGSPNPNVYQMLFEAPRGKFNTEGEAATDCQAYAVAPLRVRGLSRATCVHAHLAFL